MTTRIVDISTTTAVNLGTTDNVYVAAGVVLDVSGDAIFGTGSGHNALIAGQVSSTGGMRLGNDAFTNSGQYLEVLKGGSIYSNFFGVVMYGDNSHIVNYGTIAGAETAIFLSPGSLATRQSVTNSGTIISDSAIERASSTYVGAIDIYNSGSIIGFDLAYNSAGATDAIDRIYNKGRMQGNINFDSGNDLYDGRGGTFVGTAFGEAGDDTFIGGTGVERFDGGNNNDKFTAGLGRDRITTGIGSDKIIFNAMTEIGDIVTDFLVADELQFKRSAFGNLALGTLSSAAYYESNAGLAHDASDRFIYELDADRLWYDKDGTGSALRVLVIDMTTDVNISNADIRII